MDANQLTTKSQEALAAAQRRARRATATRTLEPVHLLLRAARPGRQGIAARAARRPSVSTAPRCAPTPSSASPRLPRASGATVAAPAAVGARCSGCSPGRRATSPRRAATPTSRPSTCCSAWPAVGGDGRPTC